MQFSIVLSVLLWLLLPAASLAHPVNPGSPSDIAAGRSRSLSISSSPARAVAFSAHAQRTENEPGLGPEPEMLSKRQDVIIPSINSTANGMASLGVYNVTGIGTLNSSVDSSADPSPPDPSIDQTKSFDQKIPIWGDAIYLEVKGDLDDQLDANVEVWVHALFDYEIITSHCDLKQGCALNLDHLKIIQGQARLYAVSPPKDHHTHLIFQAIGKVYVPFKGWRPFNVQKEILDWPT